MANIQLESSNTLAFGEPIGFERPNAIIFYLCEGTSVPFSLSPFPSTTVSQIWFLFLMFPIDLILWVTVVTS